eukprot:443980-Hanusia_phi.AAC.1
MAYFSNGTIYSIYQGQDCAIEKATHKAKNIATRIDEARERMQQALKQTKQSWRLHGMPRLRLALALHVCLPRR